MAVGLQLPAWMRGGGRGGEGSLASRGSTGGRSYETADTYPGTAPVSAVSQRHVLAKRGTYLSSPHPAGRGTSLSREEGAPTAFFPAKEWECRIVVVKVFISYSRKDEAVAQLLAHILRKNQIGCLIDRDLRSGQKFDAKLQEMIREADLVLVLLTKRAIRSQWVNQEIGFAMAHAKIIWPLAIEIDIEPYGMLATTQAYSLFDWSDPDSAIQKLVIALKNNSADTANPYKHLGFDHVIEGNLARTRFIIARLNELRRDNKALVILHQAAFSIFGASIDELYSEAVGHSPEQMDLLLEERHALEELVSMPNCSFKAIFWPEQAYERKYLSIRCSNLLSWMEKVKDDPKIDYVCAQYPGPHRLIVIGEFMIEGFKLNNQPGYEMTVVKYQAEKINEAAALFYQTFERAGDNKETARERVRRMYTKVSTLSADL